MSFLVWPTLRTFTRRAPITVAIALLLLAATNPLAAQKTEDAGGTKPAPKASASDFGLEIPEGLVRLGDGRNVLVTKAGGAEVVGKLHVEVGSRRIVIMPDGRLASIPLAEALPTTNPFVADSMDSISKGMLAGTFKGFKTRKTKRYLYIYNTSEGFYTATSRILETMYPGVLAYAKRQKLPVVESEIPLVVLMFRTEEEFQAYHPMPPGVVAYYSGVSNHVVMYEQSKLIEVAPELAVKQSISTISHEGVHQILHNIGVQKRLSSWPIWISEGLPEYFSATSTGERLRWKGIGQVNDMRMYEIDRYLKIRPVDAKGDFVDQVVQATRLSSLGYAKSWALTSFLAERRQEQFFAYLAEVSKSNPLEESAAASASAQLGDPNQLKVFEKHFGDTAKLEAELLKYLKKLPYTDPIANQTHYVVLTITGQGGGALRSAGVTASPAAVKSWQQSKLESMPAPVRAQTNFTVRPFPSRQAAEAFAEQWLNAR